MSTTEVRIRNLEALVRRQRRWNIALGALVVVGGLMAAKGIQEVPDVIRAKKIQVVDDDGKVLVGMGSDKHGGFLVVANGSEQEIAVLGAGSNGGNLVLTNNDKVPQVILGMTKDGGVINAMNSGGKVAAGMAAVENGLGFLTVKNSEGKGAVEIMSLPGDKGGAVRILGGNGKHRDIR